MCLGVFLLVFIPLGGARSQCQNDGLQESSYQQVFPGAPPPDPPRAAGGSGPGSLWSHCFVPGPSACEALCAPFQSGVCFVQSCGAPALKPCCPSELRGLLPPVTDPESWAACCGARSLTPVEEHLWCNYFPFDLIWLCCESAPPPLTVTSSSVGIESLWGRIQV